MFLFPLGGNGISSPFLLEIGLGAGKLSTTQTITIDSSDTSELSASAYLLEAQLNLSYRLKIMTRFFVEIGVGYALQGSTYFKVNSSSGDLFESFSEGDRIAVQTDENNSQEDLKLSRSGYLVRIGASFIF